MSKLGWRAYRAHIAFLLFLGLLLAAPHIGFADSDWTLVEVTGDVQILPPQGGWILVANSSAVRPGSTLRTGSTGRAVLTSNGDRIVVAPNSYLELPADGQTSNVARVRQNFGTLFYDMVPRAADRFRVDTPYLAAIIKGTSFGVGVDDNGAAVSVSRGLVEVVSNKSQRGALVATGQTAEVSAKSPSDVQVSSTSASAAQSTAPSATSAIGTSTSTAASSAASAAGLGGLGNSSANGNGNAAGNGGGNGGGNGDGNGFFGGNQFFAWFHQVAGAAVAV